MRMSKYPDFDAIQRQPSREDISSKGGFHGFWACCRLHVLSKEGAWCVTTSIDLFFLSVVMSSDISQLSNAIFIEYLNRLVAHYI
jgi:hypothetical protein